MANTNKQISSAAKIIKKSTAKNVVDAKNRSNNSARVGCVQWKMRSFGSIEDFLLQVENHVRSLAAYECDVVLFPEFFTVPLTGLTPELEPIAAMRELALR